MGERTVIKFIITVMLSYILTAQSSSKSIESKSESKSDKWILSSSNYKDVKVNGMALKKSNLWEFSSLNQIETENSDALISLTGQIYFKLFPQTLLRWNGSTIQLIKGHVYIKNQSSGTGFQINGLFNFELAGGDMVIKHDAKTKITDFEVIASPQKIKIDSDDRDISVSEGTKITFIPEFIEGEMSYDFLLNNRKIPKLKMEQVKNESGVALDIQLWKAPVKKAISHSKKVQQAKVISESGSICKAPAGVLNSCVFVKEADECARYTCNLSGVWSMRTIFPPGKLCPKIKTIRNCETGL